MLEHEENTLCLILPACQYDNPEIRKVYENYFPSVKILRTTKLYYWSGNATFPR